MRLEDKLGNAEDDAAADLGSRHQSGLLMDAGRILLRVRLHRFMIAVARVAVNHDGKGGSEPDPLVWDRGGSVRMICESILTLQCAVQVHIVSGYLALAY